ncbi:MAG TPA: S8 family serine peptidase [Flavobacteriales bacterium]|nr:S8 family serine peptidase [Flavobacteriales bacterium]HPH81096.1 S8 family serine peptidase [Flavobacteriales bacterium]
MMKQLVVILLISLNLSAFAQTNGTFNRKYWVQLTDKVGTPYSLSNPEAFLSTRAIDRRAKQGIGFKENDLPLNPAYVAQIQAAGARVINQSKWFNAVTIELTDSTLLPIIEALPFVARTNKVARVKQKSPADQFIADLMKMQEQYEADAAKKLLLAQGADAFYGNGDQQIKMLNGDKLHQMGFQGKGIHIAVLDAGFYHVDQIVFFDSLRSSGRLLGTRDFVQGGTSVFEDNSHGLSVLSTMAGNIPGVFVGTAPKASYWLLRTEDADSENLIEEDNWVRGAEFADSVGVDVINSSLGYTVFDDSTASHTYSQLDGKTARITIGADIAASKGMLIVNSAGNSGADPWKYIGFPADGDSVLSIGAVDVNRNYASFSSQGPTPDGRIKPNVTAMGQQPYVITSGGMPGKSNGTSFSSPILAGMSACLWQAHPEASAMEIFKAIEQSADQYDAPDAKKGFGIPDFLKAHAILSQLALDRAVQDSVVNVYPNPFIEGVTVEFYSTSEQDIQVKIFKLSGKQIAEEKIHVYPYVNNLIQLDKIRKLNSGQYVVSVITPTRTFSRQVIKR